MATYYGPAVDGRQLRVDITSSQSTSGNYSNVRVVMYFIGQWSSSSNSQVGVAVNGAQAYWYAGSLSLNTGTSVLSDTTTRVNHNSDGKKSVTITGGLVMPFINVSLTVQVNNLTLPTIQRVPSAPTRPTISSIKYNSMVVKFSKQGSVSSNKYQLQRSTSSSFSSPTTITSTGTSTITGLAQNTTYYFRARSGNDAGWSSWSSTGSGKTTSLPSAPSTPAASSITHNSMTLKFNHQGSTTASNWQIQRSTVSNFASGTTTTNTTTRSVNYTGLTPGTTYYFRARAQNSEGYSGWSSTRTTYTRPQANTPTVDSITATGLRVVFGRTGNASGSTTWEFQRSLSSSFSSPTTTASTGTTVVSGLVPETTYYFRSRGKNSSGAGPWSGTRSAKTGAIAAPSLAVVSGNTGATAAVSITPPSGATITGYTLEADYLAPLPQPAGADKVWQLGASSTSTTQTGLRPGAQYRWRVRAKVGSYLTAWSGWVIVNQVDPNTVDDDYFDASIPTGDPNRTRATATVAGVTVQVESAVTPNQWQVYPLSVDNLVIRRAEGSLIESAGSTKLARARLIRDVTGGGEYDAAVFLGSTEATWPDPIPLLPLATYTATLLVRATRDMTVDFGIHYLGVDPVRYELLAGEETRLVQNVDVPAELDAGFMLISIVEGEAGTALEMQGALIALGRPGEYFDGGKADTARFDYSWAGAQWNSESLRTPLPADTGIDPFADPLCPAPPTAPRPPIPENECIADVNTWRRYWSPLSSGAIPEHFDALPIFTLSSGAESDGPIRILMFDNPENLGTGDFIPGDPLSEQVVTFMPANSEAVLDAVSERSYGRTNGSETYQDIDHLVFGVGGGPATWPVLSCGTNYMIAIDVPGSSPLGNITLEASLTTRVG